MPKSTKQKRRKRNQGGGIGKNKHKSDHISPTEKATIHESKKNAVDYQNLDNDSTKDESAAKLMPRRQVKAKKTHLHRRSHWPRLRPLINCENFARRPLYNGRCPLPPQRTTLMWIKKFFSGMLKAIFGLFHERIITSQCKPQLADSVKSIRNQYSTAKKYAPTNPSMRAQIREIKHCMRETKHSLLAIQGMLSDYLSEAKEQQARYGQLLMHICANADDNGGDIYI